MSLPVSGKRVAGVAALLLASCTPGSDDSGDADRRGPEISLEPTVAIGELEGDPAYLFGDIRAIAVDAEGRVYVGDRIGATIRAYSASGEFIAQVAQEGQGPGEVDGWPAGLSFGQDGRLYVRDASRVTVFAPSGRHGIADSVAGTWRTPGSGNLTYARSRVGDDGVYYYPNGSFRVGERPRFLYSVFRGGEPTGDTLNVPYYEGMQGQRTAFYRIGPSGGRMVDGLNRVPFAPVPVWDVTGRGTVLSVAALF